MAQKFANAARAELAATINDTDAALTIVAGAGLFPVANTGASAISSAADWFKLVLQDDAGYEIIHVRTHAADSTSFSNILRGQEGTAARGFLAGAVVGLRPLASDATVAASKQDAAITSDTAPADPVNGQEWIQGTTGIKFTWVVDDTSAQWVELGPGGVPDVGSAINASTNKATPADADKVGIADSAASGLLKHLTWSSIKSAVLAWVISQANTWTALQIFAGVRETRLTASAGASYTVVNTAASILDLTLTANTAFTFPTPAAGGQFTLLLLQDATGSRIPTWPATVRWAGGTAPTLTATASRTDVITFLSDGTYWLGFVGGLNFTRA